MRLWPLAIIDLIPDKQLLGQHRECCALRGNGWGRKYSTVDYVFNHPYWWLYVYHMCVIEQMSSRKFHVSPAWRWEDYRGIHVGIDSTQFTHAPENATNIVLRTPVHNLIKVYPEHNGDYIDSCVRNLKQKGVVIDTTLILEEYR